LSVKSANFVRGDTTYTRCGAQVVIEKLRSTEAGKRICDASASSVDNGNRPVQLQEGGGTNVAMSSTTVVAHCSFLAESRDVLRICVNLVTLCSSFALPTLEQ